QRLLGVVALVQPFQPEDRAFIEIVERAAELPAHEVNRLLRVLTEGGILFKRGGRYRLSPDQLADYIVESECIGVGRRSTGYAERIFDLATGVYLEHVLLNIGKLDWRLSNGNPSNSRMLDEIWAKLDPSGDYA